MGSAFLTDPTMHDLAMSSLSPSHLWIALPVTLLFAGLARWVRGVTFSGSIAGAVICFVLYAAGGPGAFLALVTVFVLTWLATRFGYKRKQRLGTAENRGGRTASQVLANLAIATVCAAASALTGRNLFLVAAVAALAEAASDTVSSEFGQARGNTARMITNWELVPAGTNGGISLVGTIAGVAAAAVIGAVSFLVGLISPQGVVVAWIGGIAGTMADSFLGATLERTGMMGNNGVNFTSTLIAAAVALFLTRP
jgi:uncharacterized protein (TIGR00297 family)